MPRPLPSALPALALALILALAGPVAAGTVRDEASGLAFELPPGATATRLPRRGANTVSFGVRRPEEQDTGCQVAFAPAPQNARHAQAELNETARGAAWQGAARQAMSALFDLDRAEPFERRGVGGILLEGRPRILEGMAEPARRRAEQLRALFVIRETPAGRTSIVCVAEAAGYAARRAEFLALAEGMRLPGGPPP